MRLWRIPQLLMAFAAIMLLASACTASEDSTAPSPSLPTSPTSTETPPPTPSPNPTPTRPDRLLPDLRSMPAYDIHIEAADGDRLLRFSSTLANVGVGPIEIRPNDDRDCPDGQRFAAQVIYLDVDNGSGNDRTTEPAGCMVDHEGHDHWHFDASARYTLTAPGNQRPIVEADKVSFCLRDSHPLTAESGRQEYGECDRNSTQGISPGWGDEYASDLDGQALPLPSDLSNGRYCLTLAADPNGLLRESDETNNAATIGVRIRGGNANPAGASGC